MNPETEQLSDVQFVTQLATINWEALRADLIADDFHNGRSTGQLQASFENSAVCVMAIHKDQCIGTARALSDGIGNAYVVDVWTLSSQRKRGIGSRLMELLLEPLQGQHVYLQTDDAVTFYLRLGFAAQPEGLSKVVGDYLVNTTD